MTNSDKKNFDLLSVMVGTFLIPILSMEHFKSLPDSSHNSPHFNWRRALEGLGDDEERVGGGWVDRLSFGDPLNRIVIQEVLVPLYSKYFPNHALEPEWLSFWNHRTSKVFYEAQRVENGFRKRVEEQMLECLLWLF